MTIAPLSIKLYGVDNEVKREVTRSIVPWGVLEKAIDLQEQFENVEVAPDGTPRRVTKEQIQQLTDFVVFIFDDTVTREDLKRGASLGDMFALYNQVFQMVGQIMPKNPTSALTNPKTNLQKVRQGSRK